MIHFYHYPDHATRDAVRAISPAALPLRRQCRGGARLGFRPTHSDCARCPRALSPPVPRRETTQPTDPASTQTRKRLAAHKLWQDSYVDHSRKFVSKQESMIVHEATDCHEAAGVSSAKDFQSPVRGLSADPAVYELRKYQLSLGYQSVPDLRKEFVKGCAMGIWVQPTLFPQGWKCSRARALAVPSHRARVAAAKGASACLSPRTGNAGYCSHPSTLSHEDLSHPPTLPPSHPPSRIRLPAKVSVDTEGKLVLLCYSDIGCAASAACQQQSAAASQQFRRSCAPVVLVMPSPKQAFSKQRLLQQMPACQLKIRCSESLSLRLAALPAPSLRELNQVMELWRYPSVPACIDARQKSRGVAEWRTCIAKIAPSVQARHRTLPGPCPCPPAPARARACVSTVRPSAVWALTWRVGDSLCRRLSSS